MIMPMPFYINSGPKITVGNVDITVGNYNDQFYGYSAGFGGLGSKANDTLISVDGTSANVRDVYDSILATIELRIIFLSNSDAVAALDYIQANYTSLDNSATGWTLLTSNMSVSSTELSGSGTGASQYWGATDVGNTYTMEWTV